MCTNFVILAMTQQCKFEYHPSAHGDLRDLSLPVWIYLNYNSLQFVHIKIDTYTV